MPIYEYECTQCGRIHEALQKFSEKPLTTCPYCSGRLQKLISQSSFHLKGSGWYVTDYARKSTQSSTAPKSEAQKTDSTPKEAKKEAKSDKTDKSSASKKA